MIAVALRKNGILIDWLRVTVHDISLDELKDLLFLSGVNWEVDSGFYGYPRRCYFHGISINYGCDNPDFYDGDTSKVRTNMGLCLEMSGIGCRAFETYTLGHMNWFMLFCSLRSLSGKVKFKRIDLAYDDHEGVLNLDQIYDDWKAWNFTSQTYCDSEITSRDRRKDKIGRTVYIGRYRKSDVYIRIYDKAAERDYSDGERHWIRVELSINNDRADPAADLIVDYEDPGKVFSGVLQRYCAFRVPSGDSNKSRWPVAPYWSALIQDIESMRLWLSPGLPYNALRTRDHAVEQYGQTILALIETQAAGGLYGLIQDIRKRFPHLDKKYLVWIDQYNEDTRRLQAELQALRSYLPDGYDYSKDQIFD